MDLKENPYELLGVSPSASVSAIKQAYLALAKKLHPDLQAGKPARDRERMNQQFLKVQAAYEILADPVKRTRYDRAASPLHERARRAPSEEEVVRPRPWAESARAPFVQAYPRRKTSRWRPLVLALPFLFAVFIIWMLALLFGY